MSDELEDRILNLHKNQDWCRILEILIENRENVVRRKFLWIVPELEDVSWIKDRVVEKGLKGIVSVGCGCGLLERIIHENSGLEIIGVEVDRNWWQSVYSPPAFIPNIIFADESNGRIGRSDLSNYALFFCYFNNEKAFLNYIDEYDGELVFVIGPAEGQNRHTNPLPFDHKFADLGWRLYRTRQLKHSSDLICVYVRFRLKIKHFD